jgi:hypothetical protein
LAARDKEVEKYMRECTKLRTEKLTLSKQLKELKAKTASAQGSSSAQDKEESKTGNNNSSSKKEDIAHLHALQMALQLDESERRQSKSTFDLKYLLIMLIFKKKNRRESTNDGNNDALNG